MVLNFMQADELVKLKIKLAEYERKREKAESSLEDMEDALEEIQKKRQEIEDGLQETADTILSKLAEIPEKCKFRTTYYEQAKSKFLNSQSSEAVAKTAESESTAKNKIIELEDEIEDLDCKIADIEAQIAQLSQNEN